MTDRQTDTKLWYIPRQHGVAQVIKRTKEQTERTHYGRPAQQMRTSYFCPVSCFFSSPNLSGGRVDVNHTSTYGVALVRIQNAGLKCAARGRRGSLEIHDAKMTQKIAIWQHHTTLLGFIFATKAYTDNRKKNLLSSNTYSTCPRSNMVNFGPLTAEIDSGVWGTPANFNGFCVLAALLHGTVVVGVNQTLRR